MKQIEVLLVEPGTPPRMVKVKNTLEGFAEALNGPVEFGCYLPHRVMLVCREDSGKLPVNRVDSSAGMIVNGTFLLCVFAGDNFISLSPEQQRTFQRHFAVEGSTMQTVENMGSMNL